MQQYQNVLQDKFGNVIVGASVAVYVYGTTTPATIYSGNGTGLLPSNTVTTSSLGEFAFYAANGRYSLSITATNFVAESYSDFILYDPADIGAVAASSVAFTPFGTVAATNVQNAIQEVVTDLSASSGSSLVGFLQSGTSAQATTVQAKLREVVSVKDFGAVGNGIADDTAAIQACYTASVGKIVDHGSGNTYLVSATLNLASDSVYQGKSILKAKASSAISGAILLGTSLSNTNVCDLEIDANAANNGANYGIWFVNGTNNKINSCYIHDTIQAGIVIESESSSRAENNRLINCGRATGTDNHGILIYSISAIAVENILVSGNVIDAAYRKGITTYCATANGTVKNISIARNIVLNCGVTAASGGGIYCANQSTSANVQTGIEIIGNICRGNYINAEVDNSTGVTVSGNWFGFDGGSGGFAASSISNSTISGNFITNSSVHGIYFTTTSGTNSNITVSGNTVALSNTTTAGFGAGIYLNNTVYANVTANNVSDSAAKMTHGIIEGGTANNNTIVGNIVQNATSANYTLIGADSSLHAPVSRNHGFAVGTPLNTVDVNGGLTIREQTITLVNGANQNVTLPSNAGLLASNAPTGAYNIGGLVGGHSGRRITLINYTNFAMTLNHQDAGSTAANRFTLPSSTNYVVPTLGSVELVYSPTMGAWTKVG